MTRQLSPQAAQFLRFSQSCSPSQLFFFGERRAILYVMLKIEARGSCALTYLFSVERWSMNDGQPSRVFGPDRIEETVVPHPIFVHHLVDATGNSRSVKFRFEHRDLTTNARGNQLFLLRQAPGVLIGMPRPYAARNLGDKLENCLRAAL